jgi:hypothetical protein
MGRGSRGALTGPGWQSTAQESSLACSLVPGYILLTGCGGKPAWLNQNRMSPISELSRYAAHLRAFILASKCVPANVAVFDRLALDLFVFQFEHNAPYRRICEARGARPETVAHWSEIPAAPTAAFKEFELSCLPLAERTAVFHSSGTTGQQPSRHYHSAVSMALYETSLRQWFLRHVQFPLANSQLAILTPPPQQAPHSSLVHMFETIRREVGQGGSVFVGRAAKDGAWTLDAEAAVELLRSASGAGQPVLMLGTAFSYVHLLDHLADRHLCLEPPPGSCVLETGGYKGRSRSLPKATLHALISERLGIAPAHIVCEYGMSELSSQAYDLAIGSGSSERVFRFPPWARVQVVSPETGCEVGDGETGLLRVFDLANVHSVMAIQTEDLGVRRGDGFVLAGRAVLAESRGCSLMAV